MSETNNDDDGLEAVGWVIVLFAVVLPLWLIFL